MRISTVDALEDALKEGAPLLVSFTAPWCSACHRMTSTLQRIGERAGTRVTIGIVEADEEPTIPARFGVRGLPTTMLFREGAVASTRIGTLSDRQIEAKDLPPTAAPDREKTAPPEEQGDPKVAVACHQLGLVAQALEQADVAERWQIEALRTAAKLKEYGLCARSASRAGETLRAPGTTRRGGGVVGSVLGELGNRSGAD